MWSKYMCIHEADIFAGLNVLLPMKTFNFSADNFYVRKNVGYDLAVTRCRTARQVYVMKRPHVDEFLQKMGELFECVLFTASLGKVRWCCVLFRHTRLPPLPFPPTACYRRYFWRLFWRSDEYRRICCKHGCNRLFLKDFLFRSQFQFF